MRRSSASRRGFTLVELLVSLGIVTVITGLMLANFRAGSRAAELRFAADILANQYRAIQTDALAARLASICAGGPDTLKACASVACDGGTCQDRVAPGYGLRLDVNDPGFYTLFYDGDDDGQYDAGEERARQPLVSTGAVLFDGSTAGNVLDIVFTPPAAAMRINGMVSPPDTVEITLRHPVGPLIRHVSLYRISGKIEHD